MKKKPTITFRLGDDFYHKLEIFTDQFLQDGFNLFADEFKEIDSFYNKTLDDKSDRLDKSFRQQPKQNYLLEAVNFMIHDRNNREAFNKAQNTVIILPDCLALMKEKCKKERSELGKVCTRCVPNCEINKIMQFAKQFGIEGYFSKRALTEQLTKIKKTKPDLSVIGISCLLTLASGMRSAGEAGIPSRGIFLNLVGCDHWADRPFPTETAIDRLKDIIEEKLGKRT